jgi:hypothetical protein
MLLLGSRLIQLGPYPHRTWEAVVRIAGAEFVLTGSLHGAILAQAYGIPWAAYDDGYVDAPPKWNDWAAYLGIRIEFIETLSEGRQWWATEGRRGRVQDLDQPASTGAPVPPSRMRWWTFGCCAAHPSWLAAVTAAFPNWRPLDARFR